VIFAIAPGMKKIIATLTEDFAKTIGDEITHNCVSMTCHHRRSIGFVIFATNPDISSQTAKYLRNSTTPKYLRLLISQNHCRHTDISIQKTNVQSP
jgi:hypothetical protein